MIFWNLIPQAPLRMLDSKPGGRWVLEHHYMLLTASDSNFLETIVRSYAHKKYKISGCYVANARGSHSRHPSEAFLDELSIRNNNYYNIPVSAIL